MVFEEQVKLLSLGAVCKGSRYCFFALLSEHLRLLLQLGSPLSHQTFVRLTLFLRKLFEVSPDILIGYLVGQSASLLGTLDHM